VRCRLPGAQHAPGSGVTLAVLQKGPLSDPPALSLDTKNPDTLGTAGGALLYSEAVLGPHNASLASNGGLNPRQPYPGFVYLGQRMVWESAVHGNRADGCRTAGSTPFRSPV